MPGEAIELRLLGPLRVGRGTTSLPLPPSRKARGLLAYLALAARPQSRSHLCELLWDVPSDPRGELRGCLSKIRGLIDDEARRRVVSQGEMVELDLAGCFVDAREVAAVADAGIALLPTERQRSLESLFAGDLLDGLEMDASPLFNGWLIAQRQRFRACHAALLEHLARTVPDDEAFDYLERWRALAPFDPRVHESVLAWLARRGRLREGEEHLAATVALFEAEGLDSAPLRQAWRAARTDTRTNTTIGPAIEIVAPVRTAIAPADGGRRRSLAVMPFADRSSGGRVRGGVADALAQDVITRLAKLRSPLVIAQGTVFALHERGIGAEEAGRILDVDYAVSGSVREHDGRFAIAVELVETRSARIVSTASEMLRLIPS